MEANVVSMESSSKEVNLPLALLSLERNSKKHLLFDLSSKQTRGICRQRSTFMRKLCAFENRGWLLMLQHKPLHSEEQTVFLVFYVDSHGSPLVIEIMCDLSTVRTACPGDVYWSVCPRAYL